MIDLFGNETIKKETISREVLARQMFSILSHISLDEFVSLITNKFDETIEYAKLTNGEKCCQKTSLLFNAHRLDTRTKSSAKSIYQAIQTESFCDGLARAILFKKDKVKELLYQVLQLGINGVQYVNEFPPHIAVKILNEFSLDLKSKILDPCAGWGGRMIGVSVISNNYDCYEPSTKTFNGLKDLYNFIKTLGGDLDFNIYNEPFENSSLPNNYYDFALTSPPYFDTEIYTDEETNSLNRYNTFGRWTDYFYLPLISKTMCALKKEGCFVINIGSRVYPLNEILINNFSKDYEVSKLGNYLSGNSGLGREGEGEMFYLIKNSA